MKSAIFYSIYLGLASVATAVAVAVNSESQELVKRQQGKYCYKDYDGVEIVEEIIDDEASKSGKFTEFASPGYPGVSIQYSIILYDIFCLL